MCEKVRKKCELQHAKSPRGERKSVTELSTMALLPGQQTKPHTGSPECVGSGRSGEGVDSGMVLGITVDSDSGIDLGIDMDIDSDMDMESGMGMTFDIDRCENGRELRLRQGLGHWLMARM